MNATPATDLADALARARRIRDPRRRATAAAAVEAAAAELAKSARIVADGAGQALLDQGVRPAELARVLGTSRARVAQRFPNRASDA